MKKLSKFLFIVLFSFLLIRGSTPAFAACPGSCCPLDNCQGIQPQYNSSCPASQVCCTSCIGGTALGRIGGGEGFGPWGNIGLFSDIGVAAGEFSKIISRIIGVMTLVAGIWFLFQFIIAGYSYMTAGGEPKKMSDASSKITSSLLGLVIIVAAYAIISLIGAILGFDILNPQKVIIDFLRP